MEPDLINKKEYPFTSNYTEANCCDNMHYVDEGKGEVILHGGHFLVLSLSPPDQRPF
jgi:hypothetical protein